MLICRGCGKTIANVDPSTVRYGVCAACPIVMMQARQAVVDGFDDGAKEEDGCPKIDDYGNEVT